LKPSLASQNRPLAWPLDDSTDAMAAVTNFLDEVVLTGSSSDGPVQAWDVRTGMQLKAYKCVVVPRRASRRVSTTSSRRRPLDPSTGRPA